MAKKEFSYRGKSIDELKKMSIKEFSKLIPSRARKSIKRGFTSEQKKLIEKIETNQNNIKTHVRDMVIIPLMLDKKIMIHTGKEFIPIIIQPEMLGHFLGEFALTRKRIQHNAPGVGATRSSASVSVR